MTEKICRNCKHWILLPDEEHIGECRAYITWDYEKMGEKPNDMDWVPCDGSTCSYWGEGKA